jgi:hypothetical protein
MKAQMYVKRALAVTIYQHLQIVRHVQQYQNNVRYAVVLLLALNVLAAII